MNQDALPSEAVSDTPAILGIRWFPLWRRDARDLEYNSVEIGARDARWVGDACRRVARANRRSDAARSARCVLFAGG